MHEQLTLYINLFIKKITFFYCTMTIYIPFVYFPNQIEFDLKSINQEFLLFLKALNKHGYSVFHSRTFTLSLKRKLKGK